MRKYKIIYLKEAKTELYKLKLSGETNLLNRIIMLIKELKVDPKRGKGKPKRVDFRGKKYWSRRITDKHRLIYDIHENIVTVTIIKVGKHYDDK